MTRSSGSRVADHLVRSLGLIAGGVIAYFAFGWDFAGPLTFGMVWGYWFAVLLIAHAEPLNGRERATP